ncbi:MAG: diacylglycerol kinase [Deltaproteobacteria bacterium]|nr:diacylglycerol kinase [Deltaproteobacteria bacterium]
MVKNTGVKRIVLALGYSLAGLRAAFKNEAAFRQEILLAVILLPLLFLFDIETTQRLIMVATLILVLIVELINSAIEAIVDRVDHELSGRAKDIGSAAVLVSLSLMTYVWTTVLWSHF